MPFTQEYKKLLLIGRGSFASVYKVRHRELGYIRAIKISNEMVDSEQDKAYQSFLNECRLLLKIGNGSHPNIVHIYRPRLINNHALVEMDYIQGETLTDYLRAHTFVPMSEFWNFARGILSAVGYCHADLYKFLMDPDEDDLQTDPDDGDRYLITPEKEAELRRKYCVNHNDLHSNNIMRRSYDGAYILLDFGLAIQREQCVKSSSRGDGAYEYSSPEKLDGGAITPASDVYSLGILMYEMLTGQVPFPMGNSGSMADISRIYDRQLHEAPAPILPLRRAAFESANPGESYTRDYPEELEALIMRCLEKDPANRFPDAKQALLALRAIPVDEAADADSKATIDALRARIAVLEQELAALRHPEAPAGALPTIARQSNTPLQRLRAVHEEDLARFTPSSRAWYADNAFVIPQGTHLPSLADMQALAPQAPALGLDSPVWIINETAPASPTAFDPATGTIILQPAFPCRFIAIHDHH